MKKRLNRVLSLLMTCALVTSNIPVYAAGEDNSDTAAEVVAEDTIESETDDEADEAKAEQPAEEVVKDEETAAEDAMIVFYSISYDETGKVIDADYNFVGRREFEKTYSML